MRKIVLLILLFASFCVTSVAQEVEKALPLTDTEVVRRVAVLDIEGKSYYNVVMTFKSRTPDRVITEKYKVKVTVKDSNEKIIWKKTLKSVFLYVFSNGQVQVGKRNFDQIVVYKSKKWDDFIGMIREKEGVY